MTTIPYVVSEKSLTMMLNDERVTIPRGNHGFDEAAKHLESSMIHDVDYLTNLTNMKDAVKTLVGDNVTMTEDGYCIDDIKVPKELEEHLLNLKKKNYDTTIIEKFIENVMQIPNSYEDANGIKRKNPWAEQTRESIYGFLASNGYVITDDGCFLAEKIVCHDYGSIHSSNEGHRVFYKIGSTVSLPRYMCDHNPNITCSSGLHVCSDGYNFGSYNSNVSEKDRLLICKINPKNVVSIPDEYGMNKIRVCEMEVIREADVRGALRDRHFDYNDEDVYDEYRDYSSDLDHEEWLDGHDSLHYDDFIVLFVDDNETELKSVIKMLNNKKGNRKEIIKFLRKLPCEPDYENPFKDATLINKTMTRREILDAILDTVGGCLDY